MLTSAFDNKNGKDTVSVNKIPKKETFERIETQLMSITHNKNISDKTAYIRLMKKGAELCSSEHEVAILLDYNDFENQLSPDEARDIDDLLDRTMGRFVD